VGLVNGGGSGVGQALCHHPCTAGATGRGCSVPESLQVWDQDLLKGLLLEPSYTVLMDQKHLGFREIPTAPL